jgi:hypothetical protein
MSSKHFKSVNLKWGLAELDGPSLRDAFDEMTTVSNSIEVIGAVTLPDANKSRKTVEVKSRSSVEDI